MKKLYWIILLLVMAIGIVEATQIFGEHTRLTSLLANLTYRDNLHEITPGQFYRSAEMDYDSLKQRIKQLGIKSVIDLRFGKEDPRADGRSEESTVKELGGEYRHFPLRGSRPPSKQQMESLIELYDSLPKPILVHCSSGTHRSGLATAMWLLGVENAPMERAEEQLSFRFGFIRWERDLKKRISGHDTIDKILWDYQKAHQERGVTLRDWLKERGPEDEKVERVQRALE